MTILSFDPTHPTHNNINGYLWQRKGKEHTKKALSNTGRRRLTILGAINLVNQEITPLLTESNCDKELIKVFLKEVEKQYSSSKEIIIYLDNAKYQRNYEVLEYAKSLNITLKFLPPYSPNLSLIERLWKFLKKKVMVNCYYANFEDFFEAICDFFRNWDNYRSEIERLMSLKWEIIY